MSTYILKDREKNQNKAADLHTIMIIMARYKKVNSNIQELFNLLEGKRRKTKRVKHDLALIQFFDQKYNMRSKYNQIVEYSKNHK